MAQEIAWKARQMVRQAFKGALATHDAASGAPYASLVLLATTLRGAPVTIVSQLARHTKNLLASPRASILIDTSDVKGDATTGGRVSLMGVVKQDPAPHV